MNNHQKMLSLIHEINQLAKRENKLTGFMIGNTAKQDHGKFYFTPVRNTSLMVIAGVIVYDEQEAVNMVKAIDGEVQYILVDAEKKIPGILSGTEMTSNVERGVREVLKKSTLWIYKGNDLSVDAVDILIMSLTKNELRGVGNKKIAILGAGNLGCKLALKLVERGARVFLTRRDKNKLEIIVKALNEIKPNYTHAQITAATTNEEAAQQADILIGTTSGIPVITKGMVDNLTPGAFIVDAGKGTLFLEAIQRAEQKNINIYRLDVTASIEGLIHELYAIEKMMKKGLGRKKIGNRKIVSQGLLGRDGEIVVDNIQSPKKIYGIANGKGDFYRELTLEQTQDLERIEELIKI